MVGYLESSCLQPLLIVYLIKIPLLDDDVLPNYEPMGSHLAKMRKDSGYVLFKIDKNDDYGQVPSCFHKARGMYSVPPVEASDGVKRAGTGHVFLPQELKYFRMQRLVVPLIRLV
jgi:hypothetical protein